MPPHLNSILRKFKSYVIRALTRSLLPFCRFLIVENGPRISISLDSEKLEDGLGAQIQRQFSLKALAHYLRIDFSPTPIKQIAIHPLDNFADVSLMQDFLNEVNELFHLKVQSESDYDSLVIVGNLTIWKLLKIVARARRTKINIHLRVLEAYSLVDANPQIYVDSLRDFHLKAESINDLHQVFKSDICIHYRQGAGGNAVYPGQKISRELNPQYFIELLQRLDTNGKSIIVFTDAPVQDFEFKPEETQEHLWLGTPGYRNGKVRIQGLDLKNIFAAAGFDVRVVIGGDLITTILSFIESSSLLMSRSSLSYVAALLNKDGNIYYPPNFWHPPLNRWIRVK